jgi:phosphate-selective porin OprO/OprP
MTKRLWRTFLRLMFAGGAAAALFGGGAARPDEGADVRALRQQFEQQKKELEEQQKLLDSLQERVKQVGAPTRAVPAPEAGAGELPPVPPPDKGAVEKIIGDYLKQRDDAKKAADAAAKAQAEAEGYKVGTDLGMTARWNVLSGLTFSTPNKDFVSHLGFIFQYDSVWFDQSRQLKSASQIGDLQDGSFFRRVRPIWDGTAWEVMEWNVILSLEQVNNNVPNLDEVWVGLMKLPVIGNVRIGRMRIPQGLEAPQYQNSKPMTFLEQSAYSEAFYQKVAPGLWTSNNAFDQRVTWAGMIYRQDEVNGGSDSGQNGVSFGDGKYATTGRLTALPVYENDGRCLLHLGVSGTWRKAEDVPVTAGQGGIAGPTFIDYRARPLLRDATGSYGTGGLPGNVSRVVDTGLLNAASATVIGTEFLYINGPFSLQAEWGFASANDVVIPNPSPRGPRTLGLGDEWFNGGYVQLSYFLTGENRLYDKRLGRLNVNYISSPNTPFYLTRGENGDWLFGRGAWELTARYNYLNLNNGPIQGGQTEAYEVGLNWHLNNNFRIMFEYLHQTRFDKATAPGGTLSGDIDGIGIRTQLAF